MPFDPMTKRTFNVLFLCTRNSARSILAEAYINSFSHGRFRGFSGGSDPEGEVQPFPLELLKKNRMAIEDLRSKSWNEFAKPGAPHMDFVITVCDRAGGEVCPNWLGRPSFAHWEIEDPVAVSGSDAEKRTAYTRAYSTLTSAHQSHDKSAFGKTLPSRQRRALKEIGKPQYSTARGGRWGFSAVLVLAGFVAGALTMLSGRALIGKLNQLDLGHQLG